MSALTVCPKCGHSRKTGSQAPPWQCPGCGIAYHKYEAYLSRAAKAFTPPGAEEKAPPMQADGSILLLTTSNFIALAVAIFSGWRLVDLMLVYWIQSVIIGVSYFFRILNLDEFSTKNFRINDRNVDPTTATKRFTAIFFAFHYGFFHIVYLVFLTVGARDGPLLDLGLLICSAVFVVNHCYSYRYNRELDRQGTPNIGTLMFTPYLRIVPMHLTLVFGATQLLSTLGILVFGGLKTVADVAMHYVEHSRLKRCRSGKR
jgi:hypothetical protein